jgi:hypothetical protein
MFTKMMLQARVRLGIPYCATKPVATYVAQLRNLDGVDADR